jgi:AcrR family transcriptional regulator
MARGRPSKRQLILDSAIGLIAELGYQGTSIDLVVQKAGVSKPTVYNNFPTKQALFQAYLAQMIQQLTDKLKDISNNKNLAEVPGLIKLYSEIAQTPEMLAIYRVYFGEQHKLDDATAALITAFDNLLLEWSKQRLAVSGETLSATQLFMVMAVCREGIVIPALSASAPLEESQLEKIIQDILAK